MTDEVEPAAPVPWWRSAVMYEVYLRRFADGNGDGFGDIAGLRSRLSGLHLTHGCGPSTADVGSLSWGD